MTDGNPRPDAEPMPPATTRWSDDATEADDELAPPFIPGAGSAPSAPPSGPAEEPAVESATEPATEPVAEPSEADDQTSADDEAFPFEAGWDREEDESAEDDFPFGAFDIEGEDGGEAGVEAEPEEEPEAPIAATGGGSEVGGPGTAAAELAERLEAMAGRLREDGVRAAEEDMNAPDRFTALLAGLLAGYLTGRE